MSSLRARSAADLLNFTRSTTGTYCGPAGVLQTADAHQPRIEFDPVTHASRGLLLEPARTNYLLRSQEFDNASWTKTRSSISANAITAPDGTLTADKLIEDTTVTDSHYCAQTYTKKSSTEVQTYSVSVWCRAAGRTQLRLSCQGSSGSANSAVVYFDLSAGTAGSVALAGQFDNAQASIEAWPDHWYHCRLEFRINNDGQAAVQLVLMLANGGTPTYTGDGASGVYLWGAQLEKGVHFTNYIPTTTAAVARNADVCTVKDLPAWFSEPEGTIYAEYVLRSGYLASETSGQRVVQVDDGSESNRVILYLSPISRYYTITVGGVTQAGTSRGNYVGGTVNKHALAWAENDVGVVADGQSVALDTAAEIPEGLTAFRIGTSTAGGSPLNGYFRKVRYWPRRVSDTELAALVA